MATAYSTFDSTPATLVADIKTKILLSSDWANITGNIVKATTTRGAQMVVDLADAAATSNRLQLGVYRTHDGATGVDKLTRYLTYNSVTPATSTVLHCVVSAGKEHLVITVEGPRAGETGTENASWGSPRQSLILCDVVPYHASDTVPAVFLSAHTGQSNNDQTVSGYISRDQGDTTSWVRTTVHTVAGVPRAQQGWIALSSVQPVAKGDGNYYLWPYVLIEPIDGLRGRLAKIFWAGNTYAYGNDDQAVSVGTKVTYNGEGYVFQTASRSGNNYENSDALSFAYRANGGSAVVGGPGNATMLAIPDGT